jgi:HK97 family phage major capsid protein
MSTKLIEKREELAAKQKALAAIFGEAGTEIDLSKVKSLSGDNMTKALEIKRRNVELDALGKEVEALAELEHQAHDVKALGERLATPAGGITHPPAGKLGEAPVFKSLGQLFVESDTYTKRLGNHGPISEAQGVDLKTLMDTSAGWAPESLRQPGFRESAQRQPNVVDLIPFIPTSQAAIVYMLESTFTNNAAPRTEGANNAGEAALALTPTTSMVREIAVWLPVTREQMDDVAYVQAYVNTRLTLMIRQTLETQVMAGSGVAPNLAGLIGLAGAQTQAKGVDPVLDALYKGLVLVRVTGRADPNAFIMHPNDYQDIRLTRTADGIYIMGNPGESGVERLWGLPVVQSTACTENTAVVADFANHMNVAQKQGIVFEYTDSHASLFVQRTLAILASLRMAFVVYRPAAVCQVTGI